MLCGFWRVFVDDAAAAAADVVVVVGLFFADESSSMDDVSLVKCAGCVVGECVSASTTKGESHDTALVAAKLVVIAGGALDGLVLVFLFMLLLPFWVSCKSCR